jgi:succinate dehydrogenase hydrophobic anchor subunit
MIQCAKKHDKKALEMLLLIGTLVFFALWLIGLLAEENNKHYSYQANSVKSHAVLSLNFLGLQIILHEHNWVTTEALENILIS